MSPKSSKPKIINAKRTETEQETDSATISEIKPYSSRKLLLVALIIVSFSFLFNLCVKSIGSTYLTLPEKDTTLPAVKETVTEPAAADITEEEIMEEETTEEETTKEETTKEATSEEVTTKAKTTKEKTTEAKTTTAATTKAKTTTAATEDGAQAPEKSYTKTAGPGVPVTVPENRSVLLSVPFVSQMPDYPTGCEGACIAMLLRYWNINVSLDTVIDAIPRGNIHYENGKPYGPSIYEKFVGDPRHRYNSDIPGYGAFSPVITKTLQKFISSSLTVQNITGSSLSALFENLDKDCPVIVWATYKMNQPRTVNYWYDENTGAYFEYPRGTHVFVLCGYDGDKVKLMDPINGLLSYSYSSFQSKYLLLGCQAIVVTPKSEPATTQAPEVTTTEPESVSITEETTSEAVSEEENPGGENPG